MKCPFCEGEMRNGILYGDGRSKVHWNEGNKKLPVLDGLAGKGCLSSAKYTLTTFTIEASYCDSCKKMIIDTEVVK